MASSDTTQRAVLAGLSCGIGMAAPVVAYVATLPFSQVNETVAAAAVPFAVGAVAGVGVYAASMALSDGRDESSKHAESFSAPVFMNSSVSGSGTSSFATVGGSAATSAFAAQQAQAAASAPGTRATSNSAPSSVFAGITGALQRRRSLDDVPTIQRAVGAPSEDDAWAMIDSMLDEDSPVSCDPSRSHDVYEVAIDELRSGAQTGALNRDDIAAAARAVAGSQTAPAGTTAAFVSMVASAAATGNVYTNGASAQQTGYSTSQADRAGDDVPTDNADDAEARQAAVDSLWGVPCGLSSASSRSPYNAALAAMPVISTAEGQTAAPSADDTFVASRDALGSADVTATVDTSDRIDTADLPDASLEIDVPMADYSGHEDMWAAAAAILDELEMPSIDPIVDSASKVEQHEAPAYVGRHAAVLPEDTARLSRSSIERAEAITEGVLANRRHDRINRILEEEIDRLNSQSARRTGHEYLSVIEGGTASFPKLRAEA